VVVRQLGEGNHGRYYLARPPARLELAEEFVALKVFGDRVGELAYERGVRELRAFAAVRSPYLVTVYDAVLEDTFAYAMQYFPLGSLSAPARPLARAEVHRALENAARAAHALHEAGMAHSDIKPANVLLTEGSAAAQPDRRQALRPRPRPLPRARRHAHEHGSRQLGRVRRPGRHRRGAAVAAHRDLGARRHRAPRVGGHRPLRRAARRPTAAGHPEGARRPAADRPGAATRRGRARAALPRPDDGRLPTAEAVADRLAALRP
jgi:serine/threonine protein kinase